MSGPTLTMAPAVAAEQHQTPPFRQRPHSSHDDLISGFTAPPRSSPATVSPNLQRSLNSKSLPSLPAFDVPSFDFDSDSDFHDSLFLNDKKSRIVVTAEEKTNTTSVSSLPSTPPPPEVAPRPSKVSRRVSLIDRPLSWIPSPKSSPDVREFLGEKYRSRWDRKDDGNSENMPEIKSIERARTMSDSFAGFARRSWISSSRSPSPRRSADKEDGRRRKRDMEVETNVSSGSSRTVGRFSRKRFSTPVELDSNSTAEPPGSTSRALNRASVYFTKIKQKPQHVFVRSAASTPSLPDSSRNSSPTPSDETATPTSSSHDLLTPTLHSKPTSTADETAPTLDLINLPDISLSLTRDSPQQTAASSSSSVHSANDSTLLNPSEAESQTTADTGPMASGKNPMPRDPLWVAFKDMDAAYLKFASKTSTSAKIQIIRLVLAPFLRRYARETSYQDAKLLSSEDIERRAIILNKWWNGLLQLADSPPGQFGPIVTDLTGSSPNLVLQPVAGIDRPIFYEAIAMIMTRPEWRLLTTSWRPLAHRSPAERVRARSNTADAKAFEDNDQAILEESAEHNVRNMYTKNLLTQMALITDKLSTPKPHQELVSWAGKACAYAFFFVPGVADVLVRLWGFGTPAGVALLRRVIDTFGLPRRSKGESDDIVALFPPSLGPLGWSSISAMNEKLRRPARPPLQVAKVQWWTGGWIAKWRGGTTDLLFIFAKYFFVLADEFMPAELPLIEKVRAPAFVVLHAQLLNHVDNFIHRQHIMPPPVVEGADAMVNAPVMPKNLFTCVRENRLVVLLKDLLSGPMWPGAKHTYAESWMALLRAATKRISQYDHTASFLLFDFLQESIDAFGAYRNDESGDVPAGSTSASGAVSGAHYIDWQFWLQVCLMVGRSRNWLSEIRLISFLYTNWDAITSDPARKQQLTTDYFLSEDVFEHYFTNWSPLVRAYFMRFLCWRICRDSGSPNEVDTRNFILVSERLKNTWSHYLWLKRDAERRGIAPPSTAPGLPQPNRRFMIVRIEQPVPQEGLLIGFDSITSSLNHQPPASDNSTNDEADDEDTNKENKPGAKRRWSIVGKVLAMATGTRGPQPSYDQQFDQVRRDLAASRSRSSSSPSRPETSDGPPPPPKQTHVTVQSSTNWDAGSCDSDPTYDDARYIFRFQLHPIPWQVGHPPPMFRDRVLTRPRLPVPAQARVSAARTAEQERDGSPPPPRPGLPPPERRYSGNPMTGLVSEARNAEPTESLTEGLSRLSMASSRPPLPSQAGPSSLSSTSFCSASAPITVAGTTQTRIEETATSVPHREGPLGDILGDRGRGSTQPILPRVIIEPVQPVGDRLVTARYAGRALAEWNMVVNENNTFVDRRRNEGVFGLADVEVPELGVEPAKRMAASG